MLSTRRGAALAPAPPRSGRSVAVTASAALAVVAALAGCTGPAAAPSESPSVVAPTASPTPTPTPTPTPEGPVDRSNEAEGIVFEDLPDVSGHLLEAVDFFTYFHVEVNRSTIGNELTPELRVIAGPDVLRQVERSVTSNVEEGWTVSGTQTIRIVEVEGVEDVVTVDACIDPTERRYESADESGTGADFGFEPRLSRTQLVRTGSGPWTVMSEEKQGTC